MSLDSKERISNTYFFHADTSDVGQENFIRLLKEKMYTDEIASLDLEGTPWKSDVDLIVLEEFIINNPSLTSVSLSISTYERRILHILDAVAKSSIKELEIYTITYRNRSLLTSETIKTISRVVVENKNLITLTLNNIRYVDEFMEVARPYLMQSNITTLNFIKPYVHSSIDFLKSVALMLDENTTLKRLKLVQRKINDVYNLDDIFNSLKKNTTLESIHINMDRIVSKISLFEALLENKTLQNIEILSTGFTMDEKYDLIKAITENHALNRVLLSISYIDETCGELIGSMLNKNTDITCLKLEKNSTSPEAANEIFKALENNETLLELHLNSDLGLDSSILSGLSSMLKRNHTLSVLSIPGIFVTDTESIYPLDEALVENKTLNVLNIQNNRLLPSAMKELLTVIRYNTSIQSLSCKNNALGPYIDLLVDVLRENTVLEELKIDIFITGFDDFGYHIVEQNYQLSDEYVEKVINALENNENLLVFKGRHFYEDEIENILSRNRHNHKMKSESLFSILLGMSM